MDSGVCFLDIDGVVNILNIEYKDNKFYTKFFFPEDKKVNNTQALLWISKLCLEYNLDIIIASSWSRICSLEELEEILYNSGLVREVKIVGTIGRKERNVEINKIVDSANLNENYVILDDEEGYYRDDLNLQKHLILCNGVYGFGFDKFIEAKEFLQNIQKDKSRVRNL